MMRLDPVKIFYCYASADKDLQERLAKQLEPLRRAGQIITWCDREISPGCDYEQEILLHLDTSDIVLALVSPNFIDSTYCQDIELRRVLDRQMIGDVRIIPVILRPVNWEITPLGRLQALPQQKKPVVNWRTIDEGLKDVATGIEKAVQEFRSTRLTVDLEMAKKYREKGFTLYDLGFYKEAFDAQIQALRLGFDDRQTWMEIFYCLLELNEHNKSLIACEKVLAFFDRQNILNMENKFDAVNEIDLYIDFYKKIIDILRILNEFEDPQKMMEELKILEQERKIIDQQWQLQQIKNI